MTEEEKQLAVELWNAGKTGSQIANKIGVTRNAVLGFLHRLRLKNEKTEEGVLKNNGERPRKAKKQKPIAPIVVENIAMAFGRQKFRPLEPEMGLHKYFEKNTSGKTLVDLDIRSCRYIISPNDARTPIYCGKEIANRSYCAEHARICYIPLNSGRSAGSPAKFPG